LVGDDYAVSAELYPGGEDSTIIIVDPLSCQYRRGTYNGSFEDARFTAYVTDDFGTRWS